MDVFDSNIWIYGLTRTCDDAVALVEEVIDNPVHVAVSAYIFDEVMENLQRSEESQEVIHRAQTNFATIVHGNHTIHGPTQDEIEQIDIEARRRDPRVQIMSEVFDIQSKDVPILVFAHQFAQQSNTPATTIYTADEEFSQFDPRHYFENLLMQYVDCSD